MANVTTAAEVPVVPIPRERLLEADGVPWETDWHRLEMNLLIESVTYHFRAREDFFVGGNMFIYYTAREQTKAAKKQAEEDRKRAEAAEAELANLKAQLGKLKKNGKK